MEILAFLGLTPKRLVGLGAVSALTAAGAAAFAASKPPRYDAVATVFVGQALPSNGSSFDLGPLVADFRTIATSRLIREQVADATNTDAADLAVTAARDGDGSSVEIIVTGPDAAVAQDAARVVGAESMRELAGRGVRRSERLLSDRQAAVTESQSKLDELSKAQGFVDPVQTYAALQTELNRLALLVEDPTSQLTPADREALKGRILALTNQLPDMAIRAETFRLARAELTQAEDDARAAGRSLLEAKTLQVEATDSAVVSVYEATAASTLPAMVQAGGAAAVVTGLVGTGLIAAMDTRRRRTEMDRVPAATTRAASPPDPRDLTDAQKRQLREPAAGGATRSPRLGNQAPERTSPLMQARGSDTERSGRLANGESPARAGAADKSSRRDGTVATGTAKSDATKAASSSSDDTRAGDTKAGDTKAGDTKTADAKTGDTKAGVTKPDSSRGDGSKGDAKSADTKTGDTKTGDTKTAAGSSAKSDEDSKGGASPSDTRRERFETYKRREAQRRPE